MRSNIIYALFFAMTGLVRADAHACGAEVDVAGMCDAEDPQICHYGNGQTCECGTPQGYVPAGVSTIGMASCSDWSADVLF